jgi:hypothetical protein
MEAPEAARAWRELAENFRLIDERHSASFGGQGPDTLAAQLYAMYLPATSDDGAWFLGCPRRSSPVGEGAALASAEMHFRTYAHRALKQLKYVSVPSSADSRWCNLIAESARCLPELRHFVSWERPAVGVAGRPVPEGISHVCEASALLCEWFALLAESGADFPAPATNGETPTAPPPASNGGPKQTRLTPGTERARAIEEALVEVSRRIGFRALRIDLARAAGYSTTRQLEQYQANNPAISPGCQRKFDRALLRFDEIAAVARERRAKAR